jgi:hypothetical protein
LLEPLLSNRLEGKGQRLNRLCVPPRDAEVLRRQDQGPQVKQVTFIKEKTMTPESGFKHASVPANLLRGTALAIALFVSASPSQAETVTLICQVESGPYASASFTLRIDFDRKMVDLLLPDGTARYSVAASITQGSVDWDVAGEVFRGNLNRLTGQGWEQHLEVWNNGTNRRMSPILFGPCRRATQKF